MSDNTTTPSISNTNATTITNTTDVITTTYQYNTTYISTQTSTWYRTSSSTEIIDTEEKGTNAAVIVLAVLLSLSIVIIILLIIYFMRKIQNLKAKNTGHYYSTPDYPDKNQETQQQSYDDITEQPVYHNVQKPNKLSSATSKINTKPNEEYYNNDQIRPKTRPKTPDIGENEERVHSEYYNDTEMVARPRTISETPSQQSSVKYYETYSVEVPGSSTYENLRSQKT